MFCHDPHTSCTTPSFNHCPWEKIQTSSAPHIHSLWPSWPTPVPTLHGPPLDLTWNAAPVKAQMSSIDVPSSMMSTPTFGSPLNMEDLTFLLSRDEGPLLLDAIGRQDWSALLSNSTWTIVLQDRCALCGIYQARPQSLNSHLRQQHSAYLGDVVSKAAQFVRAFETGDHCRLCDKSYKQAHQCHVWAQIALIYLRMPRNFCPYPGPIRKSLCFVATFAV